MAKKANSTHSSHEEKPIMLDKSDGKSRRQKSAEHNKHQDSQEIKEAKARRKQANKPKEEMPTSVSHKVKFPSKKHRNNPSAFNRHVQAQKYDLIWEALVYGALERDGRGNLIFRGQESVLVDGRLVKRGGYPLRKVALCTAVDEAWAKIPQGALVRALSDYGVFKDRFYRLSPYYKANEYTGEYPDWAHALQWWDMLSPLHNAGLKLYHIFWVLAFMLDNGVSAREALIYWRLARITKASRHLYITPSPRRKIRHAWAKSIAWFESGNLPVGVSEGRRYEQWAQQPRLRVTA